MLSLDIQNIINEYYILKCKECKRYIFDARVYDQVRFSNIIENGLNCLNCGKWYSYMNHGTTYVTYFDTFLTYELEMRNKYFKYMINKDRENFDRTDVSVNLW